MVGIQALEGIKVADFSWVITGPLATRFLAEHGALVIKIENTAYPDQLRTVTPYRDDLPGVNRSGLYADYNAGKYGITLDLNKPGAMDIARKLVTWADVVVEAFTPGTMEKWGLNYHELEKLNPDIIMIRHTIQGQNGPFASMPLLGYYVQAGVGITDLTGWPDREPTGTPLAYPDFTGCWITVIAILAALDHRRRTGKGQHIDVSQMEATLHFIGRSILDYTANGRVQACRGNHSSRAVPHGAYRCKGGDRWCALAVFSDEEWKSLCNVIGNPGWAKAPHFSSLRGRKEHEDELDKLLEEWTIKFTAEEVMTRMQAAGVTAGVVQNGEDLVDSDPQLKYRNHFLTLNHPEIGLHTCEAAPFRLSKTPGDLRMPAPCLGQHNEYVCTKVLGIPDEDFVELMQAGVFG